MGASDVVEASAIRTLVRHVRALKTADLPVDIVDEVKRCLQDMIACSLVSGDLPWSRQAVAVTRDTAGGGVSTVIGGDFKTSCADAAFANAVQAHGLIQEDMHPPSSSHIGVVVLPAALAVAESMGCGGSAFIAAVVAGYEVMGRLGRVLVDSSNARIFRPTGMIGPVGGAVAAACLMGLDEDAFVNAVGLAGNQAVGLNQWPHTGTTEVFFHAGFAARNGVMSALLARSGATAAESIVDGCAGMVAAYGGRDRLARLTQGLGASFELSSVYHKPAPACNFAQTPCQAALALVETERIDVGDIAHVDVLVPEASAAYPGCDQAGPMATIVQAKTSIQYGVAAVLVNARIDEDNYRALGDERIAALARRIGLRVDADLTRAYPGRQGAEVRCHLHNGEVRACRLEDLRPLDAAGVQERFLRAATRHLGADRAHEVHAMVESLGELPTMADLMERLAGPAHQAAERGRPG